MLISLLRSLTVHLYSLLTIALLPVVRFAAIFHPKLREQLADRPEVSAVARSFMRQRGKFKSSVVFFCSSAGEYEQAKPLIDRLQASHVYTHVVFFSKSGYAYAKSRNETTPCSLSAADSIWNWGWFFSALRPDLVVVVRHELWPGFLHAARNYARLCLIDASRSLGEASSRSKRFVKGQMLRYFDAIYLVSDEDKAFFERTYRLPASQLRVVGDTKFDRVVERARQKNDDAMRISKVLTRAVGEVRLFFIGSAHIPDVEVCLEARSLLGAKAASWRLVVAPHDVDSANIEKMLALCIRHGLHVLRYSQLEQGGVVEDKIGVILIDRMGLLAEAYGCGELAFVGGGMHYQVHNVLEPASRGLALAFGPFYKNSQEAEQLVEAGLATVCVDAQGVASWWSDIHTQKGGEAVESAVSRLTGAADRIMQDWNKFLHVR